MNPEESATIRNNESASDRVAFYCSSKSYGGLEINVLRLIQWMQERGTSILLFAYPESPLATAARELKIKLVEIDINKKYFDFKHAKKVAAELKRFRIKLLFVGATRDVQFGSLIKRFYCPALKLVYQQHMQLGVPKRDFLHTMYFKQYDAWITPLQYLKDQVQTLTKFDMSKVHVIPFCIDTKQMLQRNISREEARRELHLPDDKIIIGTLGRIDPKKDQEFLVRAIQSLRSNNYNIDALLMGAPTLNEGNDYYNRIQMLVKDFGLDDHIHFRPFTDDTVPFFKAIDFFAMTTTAETYGMVTIEAMAHCVPVIANNTGGSKEILEQGNLGFLYEPGNLEDFTNKVIRLLKDENVAMNFKMNGARSALNTYDKKFECEKIENLFKKLLSR